MPYCVLVSAVKNVAAEIADKLCQSVATKLEGRVLGTFNSKCKTSENMQKIKQLFLITSSAVLNEFVSY